MSRPKWQAHRQPKRQTPHTPKVPPSPSFEENFKIFLRVKPGTTGHPRGDCLRITSNKEVEILPPYYSTEPERIFEYEEVFGQAANNLQVFERTMREPIRNVLGGFNSTVFIYGMTGAGKTYTMFNGQTHQEGMVGLTLDRLFSLIRNEDRCKFQILLSFFEIYNENIKDLLAESQHQHSIMEDPVKGVFINDLSEISIENAAQAKTTILDGLNRRSHNATCSNQYSSRSHAILQFTLKKFKQHTEGEVAVSQSKLFLIDLAGNEKAGQNQSKRFVEGININKSLLTLGKCINILADQKKPAFIPFRDSKLTRILKDSLGGSSKTVMIACVSPEAHFYEQTLNTLKYSTKARRIKNKGKATSIRLIHPKQVPHDIVHRCQTDPQPNQQPDKLYLFVNVLQTIIQEKVRLQRMREELEQCYFENETEMEKEGNQQEFATHMKEISELLPKLNHKYNQLENNLEQQVKRFINESKKLKDVIHKQQIKSYKQRIKEQQKQLNEMKKIINDQKNNINALTHDKYVHSSNNQLHTHSVSQTIPVQNQSSNKLSTPVLSQNYNLNNTILIHQSNGKSEGKKCIHIEIATSKNSNKQNISFLNDYKRANTPQSSMHSSKILNKTDIDKAKAQKKTQEKPTINITMDSIKLKSPTLKLQTKQSNSSIFINKQLIDTPKNKESFVGRLAQMDKNMQKFSKQQLKEMIQEFNSGGYQVNKMQMSMVNKLKFMARASEKSTPNDAMKKDRSLIK